jgi:hypothetical protein
MAGRALWNVTDQAVSSITNAAGSIFAALSLSAMHFGYFAVAITVTTLVLQLVRQLAGQPLVITAAGLTPDVRVAQFRAATGAALYLGVAFGGAVGLGGLLVGGPGGGALLAAACILPGVAVQDVAR